jgi:hypothetical protein
MQQSRPLKGLWVRYLAIVATLVGIVVVVLLAGYPAFLAWYIENIRMNEIQNRLGFEAQLVDFPDGDCCVWKFVSISPGGRFSRAGVQAGDLAVGYKHGYRSGFLYSIRHLVNGTDDMLTVVAEREYLSGPRAWRQVHVPAQ